jgi:tight adherence protein C
MLDILISAAGNPKFLIQLLIVVGTIAAVLTVGAPLITGDALEERMKAVAIERERLRGRAREEMGARPKNNNLRQAPKPFMKQVVEKFNLTEWLSVGNSKLTLARAGFRGPQAEIGLLFFRLVTPPLLASLAIVYVFVLRLVDVTPMVGGGIVVGALYLGLKTPELYLNNVTEKRREAIRRSFPDALDLLLICVESGIAIEGAFQRVGQEIGQQSIELAEEMTLTMAELSYLPDRQKAYENFGDRVNIDSVREIVMVMVQAERVGTPLAAALRTVSQETRARRLLEAEKKAASLPPKLTIPMMIFFLPCIFAVLLTPAAIQIMAVTKN